MDDCCACGTEVLVDRTWYADGDIVACPDCDERWQVSVCPEAGASLLDVPVTARLLREAEANLSAALTARAAAYGKCDQLLAMIDRTGFEVGVLGAERLKPKLGPQPDFDAMERSRCHRCDKPVASQEDWDGMPEGEGEHLCWEQGDCPMYDWRSETMRLRAELAAADASREELMRTTHDLRLALAAARDELTEAIEDRKLARDDSAKAAGLLAAARAEVERVTKERDEAITSGRILSAASDRHFARATEEHTRAEKAEAEVERTRIQLAGCSLAAVGTDLDLSRDAYGWSVAFSDVADLYRRVGKAEAEAERLRAENGNLSTLVVRTMDDMESLRTTVRALLPDVAHKVDEVAK